MVSWVNLQLPDFVDECFQPSTFVEWVNQRIQFSFCWGVGNALLAKNIPGDRITKKVADLATLWGLVRVFTPCSINVYIEKTVCIFYFKHEFQILSPLDVFSDFLHLPPVRETRLNRVSCERYGKTNVRSSVWSKVFHQSDGQSIIDVQFFEPIVVVIGCFS